MTFEGCVETLTGRTTPDSNAKRKMNSLCTLLHAAELDIPRTRSRASFCGVTVSVMSNRSRSAVPHENSRVLCLSGVQSYRSCVYAVSAVWTGRSRVLCERPEAQHKSGSQTAASILRVCISRITGIRAACLACQIGAVYTSTLDAPMQTSGLVCPRSIAVSVSSHPLSKQN